MHSLSQRIRVESLTPPWLPVPAFSGGLGSQRAEELRCRLGSPGADPGSPVLHLPQIGVHQPRGQKVVGSVISRQRLLQTLHVRSLGSSSAPLPTPGERAPHRLPEPMKLARLGWPAAWLAGSLAGQRKTWLRAPPSSQAGLARTERSPGFGTRSSAPLPRPFGECTQLALQLSWFFWVVSRIGLSGNAR